MEIETHIENDEEKPVEVKIGKRDTLIDVLICENDERHYVLDEIIREELHDK